MLSFGSITPGAGANLWELNGAAPNTIKTTSQVTGIKNPLPANPDFRLYFEAGIFGTDYFGGWVYQDLNNYVVQGLADVGANTWIAVVQSGDNSTNEGSIVAATKTNTFRTVTDAAGTTEISDEITTARGWRVIDSANSQDLFRIGSTGRINTNQLQSPGGAGIVQHRLPVFNISGVLEGYIRVYST